MAADLRRAVRAGQAGDFHFRPTDRAPGRRRVTHAIVSFCEFWLSGTIIASILKYVNNKINNFNFILNFFDYKVWDVEALFIIRIIWRFSTFGDKKSGGNSAAGRLNLHQIKSLNQSGAYPEQWEKMKEIPDVRFSRPAFFSADTVFPFKHPSFRSNRTAFR